MNLKHENIIKLVEPLKFDEQANEYFCVFEYASGGEFYDFVEHYNGFGSYDENIVRTYFLQILSGLTKSSKINKQITNFFFFNFKLWSILILNNWLIEISNQKTFYLVIVWA